MCAFDSAVKEIGILDRAPTAWQSYIWPIKFVMAFWNIHDGAANHIGTFQRLCQPSRGQTVMQSATIAVSLFASMLRMLMTGTRVFGETVVKAGRPYCYG